MLRRADYSSDEYIQIFEAKDDVDAIRQAEELAEDDDFLFNVFEISEDYEEIRTIL